jgi:hypothetical protein
MRAVLALLLAAGALTAPAASAAVPNPDPALVTQWEPCEPDTGVTVVVDYRSLGDQRVHVACALGDQPSGVAALRNAGFDVAGTQRWGDAFVCRIDGLPTADQDDCIDTPASDFWWSYWKARPGGQWGMSAWGAADPRSKPAIGSVEGWSFNGVVGQAPPPRLPAQDGRGADALELVPRASGPQAAHDAHAWLAEEQPTLLADTTSFGVADTQLLLRALAAHGDPAELAPALVDMTAQYLQTVVFAGEVAVSGGDLAAALLAVAGRDDVDPTAFAGRDLRATLTGLIAGNPAPSALIQPGQLMNRRAGGDYRPVAGIDAQARAVHALALGGGAPQLSISYLLTKQPPEGCFAAQCSAALAYVGTAAAIEALVTARDGGVAGLDAAIESAADWLTAQQTDDGGIRQRSTDAAADAKATAATIPALVAGGRIDAARDAAGWLSQLQIATEYAGEGPGRDELGAVAPTAAALGEALRFGLPDSLARQQSFRPLTIATLRALALAPYGDHFATLDRESLEFDQLQVGSPSDARAVVLANRDPRPLPIGSVELSGAHAADFAVDGEGCADTTLAPHETCTLEVRFDPAGPGDRTAFLHVALGSGSQTAGMALAGTATAPPDTGPDATPRPRPEPSPGGGSGGSAGPPASPARPSPRRRRSSPPTVTGFEDQRVTARRTARVARLSCPRAGTRCRLRAPSRAWATIAGRRHALALLAPRSVAAGERAVLRVRLSGAAARRLRGRRARVTFAVTIVTADGRARHRVRATIEAGRS